jgi:lipopolysaccharide assembly protein B
MNLAEVAIILLPIASFTGYLLGRRNSAKNSADKVNLLSKQYFQGLNHLLNEEQDQAIALFERIAEDDLDRFDMQLALGNLFRRRGELERAIRLHQELSTQAMLTSEQRALALLELGEDFVRAGLLDRAEALFDELLQIDAQSAPALKHLVGIYEQERDWQKAIEAASRYQQLTGDSMAKWIAHFYCERACEATNVSAHEELLLESAKVDPSSVRVALMQATRALAAEQPQLAVEKLKMVLELDPQFIPEAAPLILKLSDVDKAGAIQLLQEWIKAEKGVGARLCLADLLPVEAAQAMLREYLVNKPSARVLAKLLQLREQDALASSEQDLQDRPLIFAALKQANGSTLTHRCGQCGFGTVQQHWLCPSCKSWGSTKPIALT